MAAADDLEGIANYLYLHHPEFAASTLQRLYDAAKSLKTFPHAGRVGMKIGIGSSFSPRYSTSSSTQ
jgi:plasmid stabilization system protein ParE